MILVIDCNLKEMKISAFKEKRGEVSSAVFIKTVEEVRDDETFRKCIRAIAGKDRLTAISFRILFGGDSFDKPVFVGPEFFGKFGKLTDFFPFYIPSMLTLLKRFRKVFPGIPLIAFFETSFFLGLPDAEKYYALPFEYYKDNKIKKWGFHGIFHEANAGMTSPEDRVISIVFDKQTTVSAIHKRRPLSISLGYTPLEGVMSRTACGDLDPGIVFYLMNVHGFSIYKIDEMLKNESGFVGLTGYDISLSDMLKLRGKDVRVDLAFDVYRAQIMKHIGEGVAVLGGLDKIIIAGNNADMLTPVIYDIMKKISFLGITIARLPWDKDTGETCITSEESKIPVYINRMDPGRLIFHETGVLLRVLNSRPYSKIQTKL